MKLGWDKDGADQAPIGPCSTRKEEIFGPVLPVIPYDNFESLC